MNIFEEKLARLKELQEEYRLEEFTKREEELVAVSIPAVEKEAWEALFTLYPNFHSAVIRYTFMNSFRAEVFILKINGEELGNYYLEDHEEFKAWLIEYDLSEELVKHLNSLVKEMSVKHIIDRSVQGRGSHAILYTRPS